MQEEPFFFSRGGCDLFGFMHWPETSTPGTAFVLCAPFAEEKLWTQLVFVNFARELARRGHPVLRFDYRGTGDSDGNFEDATVETYLADIAGALGILKDATSSARGLGLLGLRFGATLAAMAAEAIPEVDRLVLWSPILRGAEYMQSLLRINLAMQMALHKEVRAGREALIQAMRKGRHTSVDGYLVSAAMYDEISAIDLLVGRRQSPAQCLVVQVAARPPASSDDEIERLAALFGHGATQITVEEPFWREVKSLHARTDRLFADTLNWLDRTDHDLQARRIPQP